MHIRPYWVRRMLIVLLLGFVTVTNARELIIQPGESEIRILVYRAGAFSGLGHNHVIHTRNIKGKVWVNDKDFSRSSMSMLFSVSSLIIDDDKIRNQEGEDFPGKIPKEDITGTRINMMTKVLHAQKYPLIKAKSIAIKGQPPNFDMIMELLVYGKTTKITVPTTIEYKAGIINAKGQTELLQSNLGITPLSILFGAIAVQDKITVKFEIVAK